MAVAEQIKTLIKSFGEGDEDRFFASAMQIAASEARSGHTTVAQELKIIIEKAKKTRSLAFLDQNKVVPISQSRKDLRELIDVYHPRIRLGDMVLDSTVQSALTKLIDENRKIDILRKHNLTPSRKLLLTGPPGCGKTMSAQAIAGELGVPVFIVRLDGLISKFMGESIGKLRMIFDAMPENRGVYLFDEFDSIGTHRQQGHELGEIKRILNSFLMFIEKDTSHSIIVAATNLPEVLDKALFRRFDDIISYPLPEQNDIIKTLEKNLRGFKFKSKVSFDELAKSANGLSYADIAKACEECIKDMILNGRKTMYKKSLIEALSKRKK